MTMEHKFVNNALIIVKLVTLRLIVHYATKICHFKELTSLKIVHATKVILMMEPTPSVNNVIFNVKIVLVLILIIAQSALIQYH
jgi:hypothetical protein